MICEVANIARAGFKGPFDDGGLYGRGKSGYGLAEAELGCMFALTEDVKLPLLGSEPVWRAFDRETPSAAVRTLAKIMMILEDVQQVVGGISPDLFVKIVGSR